MAANAMLRRLARTISRRPEWILALAATGVVVWLHCFFLWHVGGLWRDEANLVNLSGRHSLAEMSQDSFPVLMPLLVAGWTSVGLGQNDLSLRMLGTLLGLALPAAMWWSVWKIHRRPPLPGLVLLTLNSTVIMFGDSLRAFGLGSVLILLTAAAAGWFLQNPTWRRAGVLSALAILSVQSLFQNAVFIAALCFGNWAVCLRQKDPRSALKILVVALVSAASLLPYWPRFISLSSSAAALRVGFHPGYVFTNVAIAAGFPWAQYVWVWGFFALAVVLCGVASCFVRAKSGGGFSDCASRDDAPLFGKTTLAAALVTVTGFLWFAAAPAWRCWILPLSALAIIWCDRRFAIGDPQCAKGPANGNPPANRISKFANDLPLFAAVTLLTAFAGFAGFLWYAALLSEPWYFLPLLALTAATFEIGLPASRHFRAAIIGLAAMTIVLAIPAARGDLSWRFTNVDLLAKKLTSDAGPGDFIVVNPWYCGITFERYYKGPAAWETLPPLDDHSTHRYDLVLERMKSPDAIRPVLNQIATALQTGHRVWVVGGMDIPKAGAGMPADLPPVSPDYSGPELRYTGNWQAQTAQFLSHRSRRFAPVDFPMTQNTAPENLKLFMAEGWQNPAGGAVRANAPTNAP